MASTYLWKILWTLTLQLKCMLASKVPWYSIVLTAKKCSIHRQNRKWKKKRSPRTSLSVTCRSHQKRLPAIYQEIIHEVVQTGFNKIKLDRCNLQISSNASTFVFSLDTNLTLEEHHQEIQNYLVPALYKKKMKPFHSECLHDSHSSPGTCTSGWWQFSPLWPPTCYTDPI